MSARHVCVAAALAACVLVSGCTTSLSQLLRSDSAAICDELVTGMRPIDPPSREQVALFESLAPQRPLLMGPNAVQTWWYRSTSGAVARCRNLGVDSCNASSDVFRPDAGGWRIDEDASMDLICL
ncbi:MAG: hypothetical protein ACREO3_06555 [Arenimonas sp.]